MQERRTNDNMTRTWHPDLIRTGRFRGSPGRSAPTEKECDAILERTTILRTHGGE
jgi:hypothetical protein